MEHIYAVRTGEQLARYQRFVQDIQPRLDAYVESLEREYEVRDLPRAILWTDPETATHLISDIPVPAYTNEYRVVLTPELESWRDIFLKQLDGLEGQEAAEVRDYYQRGLSQNHVMQILGHELAHHSAFFPESDYTAGIWFEEGMVEYISRRYFLTAEEFDAEAAANRKLVEMLTPRLGGHSLEDFGLETYKNDYASIYFEYWRSFLAVLKIAEDHGGDIRAVFRSYQAWNERNSGQSLSEWFHI